MFCNLSRSSIRSIAWYFLMEHYSILIMGFCSSPTNHREKHVKRITGLPGDWISAPHNYDVIVVPEGHCWVEGDNSALSFDSRSIGPVYNSLLTFIHWLNWNYVDGETLCILRSFGHTIHSALGEPLLWMGSDFAENTTTSFKDIAWKSRCCESFLP